MIKNKISLLIISLGFMLYGCDQKTFNNEVEGEEGESISSFSSTDRSKELSKSLSQSVVIEKPMLPFIYSTLKEYSNDFYPAIFNDKVCYSFFSGDLYGFTQAEIDATKNIHNIKNSEPLVISDILTKRGHAFRDATRNLDLEAIYQLELSEANDSDKKFMIDKKEFVIENIKKRAPNNLKIYESIYDDNMNGYRKGCILLTVKNVTKPSSLTTWSYGTDNYYYHNLWVSSQALADVISIIADELSSKPNLTEDEYKIMILDLISRKDILDVYQSTFKKYSNGKQHLLIDKTGGSRSFVMNEDSMITQNMKGNTLQQNGVVWLGDGNTIKGKNYTLKTTRVQQQQMNKTRDLGTETKVDQQQNSGTSLKN